METWEGGIRGTSTPKPKPTPEAASNNDDQETDRDIGQPQARSNIMVDTTTTTKTNSTTDPAATITSITDNATRNITLIRKDAQSVLAATQDQTGVHSMEDLKAIAAEMMKLATDCIKEFMAGYRQGRDDEIEKMLHEYFQSDNVDDGKEKDTKGERGPQQPGQSTAINTTDSTTLPRRKRRKPQRLRRDKYVE
jgi:hypothetical protein